MAFPFITAEQAAELVNNGDNVGFSGFTAAGTPKFVAPAIAAKAKKEHEAGRPFKINVFTGASTNDYIDGELARADAVNFRTPYQSCKDTRARPQCSRNQLLRHAPLSACAEPPLRILRQDGHGGNRGWRRDRRRRNSARSWCGQHPFARSPCRQDCN